MKDEIDIKGLDKAQVLAALYNNAKPLGLGFFHATGATMTKKEAQSIINGQRGLDFDYVKGRPLKVNLSGDKISTYLYDRDQGQGAAATAIESLKKGVHIPSKSIEPNSPFDQFAVDFKEGKFGAKSLDAAMQENGFGFQITTLGDNDFDSSGEDI
jgi:hypothetical protein